MSKRKTPEINASTMADIAFLLLSFFLVSTTFDVDQGIFRKLPEIPPQDEKPPEVKERNLFVVLVNKNDELLVEGEFINLKKLKPLAIEFIKNPSGREDLPEMTTKNFEGFGSARVHKDGTVVSLRNDVGTSYEMYIKVQNELAIAFHDVRDEFSKAKWGIEFDDLVKDRQDIIKKIIPLSISEAEPKRIGGKK